MTAHVRVQLAQPGRPQVAGGGVVGAAVDEHGEPVAALGGPVDEERVTEVGRVEAADHQPRRRPLDHVTIGHVTAASTTIGPRKSAARAALASCDQCSPSGRSGGTGWAAIQVARSTTAAWPGWRAATSAIAAA